MPIHLEWKSLRIKWRKEFRKNEDESVIAITVYTGSSE
jgi:hypothetical protein